LLCEAEAVLQLPIANAQLGDNAAELGRPPLQLQCQFRYAFTQLDLSEGQLLHDLALLAEPLIVLPNLLCVELQGLTQDIDL
jgi:hypothetical protein